MGKFKKINSFTLKIIAAATMAADHAGAVLFPETQWLRIVGRMAFPIYCFLLVEGYVRTKNVRNYIMRLLAFALVSEIPFDLAFFGVPFYMGHQNVFFTLAAGLSAVWAIDSNSLRPVRQDYGKRPESAPALINAASAIACFAFAYFFRTDYSYAGVLLIVCFYVFRNSLPMAVLSLAGINMLLFGGIQGYAVIAAVPIVLYNGARGPKLKYVFYLFYPVHLVLLALAGTYW